MLYCHRSLLWAALLCCTQVSGQLDDFVNADRNFTFSSPTSIALVLSPSSTSFDTSTSGAAASSSVSSNTLTTTSWPTSLSFTSASVEWSPLIAPTPTFSSSQSQTTPSSFPSATSTASSGASAATQTSQTSSSSGSTWNSSETIPLSSETLSVTASFPQSWSSEALTSKLSPWSTTASTFKTNTVSNSSSRAAGSKSSGLTATATSTATTAAASSFWLTATSSLGAAAPSSWGAAATSSRNPYSNSTVISTTISCTPLSPGQPMTIYSYLPSVGTTTVTLPFGALPSNASWTNSSSTSTSSPLPTYCLTTSSFTLSPGPSTSTFIGGASSSSSLSPQYLTTTGPLATPRQTTTVYVSSKTSVTVYTSQSPLLFGSTQIAKETVAPTFTSAAVEWSPLSAPPPRTAQTSPAIIPVPVSTVVGGVSVVLSPTQVIIGGQTVTNRGGSSTTVVAQGQTFTINPSQVIAPSTVLGIPTGGGVFMQEPSSTTVIDGVSVIVGPSSAIIGGSTYNIGAGASEKTIVVGGQSVSIGPQGLGFAQVTVAPQVVPTNVVILDGELISAIGSSIAVIGVTTFTYGPGIAPQTDIIDGQTVILGPSGIKYGTTTLGGDSNGSGVQIGLAGGLTVSEIGSTLALISGTTFMIGPGAIPTTAVINGDTITAGPSGLGSGGMTLSYPFNPTTQVITYGGITLTEVGSLVNIGGTTFTVGPTPTTDLYGSETISIGPNGIGFKSTTFTAATFTGSMALSTVSAAQTSKKNGAGDLSPFYGVLGICIALGIGINI